jgi:hypothetical protein
VTDKLRSLGKRGGVYVLSLPERTLRSVSALAGGLFRETAAVVLPIGVRRGRLYRNLVDVTLQFLIEKIGQVDSPMTASRQELAENFLARRAAGNGIELMGLLTFRASPVWVLAALADVCGFGRQLIPEIADELKKAGLLDQGQSFASMEQLLGGLERSAAQLAETVNVPPLDVAGLRSEWTKLVAEVKQLPAPQLPTSASVRRVWSELRAEAEAQRRSVFVLSSLIALSAVGELPQRALVLSRSAGIALRHGGTVVADALLTHYRDALEEIRSTGVVSFAVRQLSPYGRAALAAFHPSRETLTGKLLDKSVSRRSVGAYLANFVPASRRARAGLSKRSQRRRE